MVSFLQLSRRSRAAATAVPQLDRDIMSLLAYDKSSLRIAFGNACLGARQSTSVYEAVVMFIRDRSVRKRKQRAGRKKQWSIFLSCEMLLTTAVVKKIINAMQPGKKAKRGKGVSSHVKPARRYHQSSSIRALRLVPKHKLRRRHVAQTDASIRPYPSATTLRADARSTVPGIGPRSSTNGYRGRVQ